MRKYNRIIAFALMAVTLITLLPVSISAQCAVCRYDDGAWCEAAHPHEYFKFCSNGCGSKLYLGTYATKSNCSICNSALTECQHSITWTSDIHPHETVCRQCCKTLSYGFSSSCEQCCPGHSGYYYTSSYHESGGYHERYLYCTRCGNYIYDGAVYYVSSCDICNPPKVSKVSLSASGESTTIYSSGIIEATSIPSSISVSASCENCTVKSIYYYDNNGSKVVSSSYTANSSEDFGSKTFYVTTNTGVTDSITVNFTFARYAEAGIKWEYVGATIRSISLDGRTISSGLSTSIDLD